MTPAQADPVLSAVDAFGRLDSYSVTLRSSGGGGGGRGGGEVIRYFYRKPGFVRMEFVTPRKGSLLVYDPEADTVRVRPFGFIRPLVLTLSPQNRLLRSSGGHTVDRSDIGALLENVMALRKSGELTLLGEEEINGRPSSRVRVTGGPGATALGTHSYELWMDKGSRLPVRVRAFDLSGDLTEDVLMDDLAVDPPLPEGLFRID